MNARCIETRSSLDRLLGMECYLTDSWPVKPSSSLDPDNFRVYEYVISIGAVRPPMAPPQHRGGDLYIYVLIKRGIDTYNAIKRVKKILNPKRISYYGLKDARATTYQLIVVEKPATVESYIHDRDIEALIIGTTDRHARRGGNAGNCFEIRIGSLVEEKDLWKIPATLDQVEGFGFIPNYYSYQRFGVKRPITHIAGMRIMCKSYEDALKTIVTGDPYAETTVDLVEICNEILSRGPRWMNIERIMCRKYIETRDPRKTIRKLPKTYLELYISASLSYIFNLYLSTRWRDHGLGLDPVEGEIFVGSPMYGKKIPGIIVSTEIDSRLGYIVLEALRRYGLDSCRPSVRRTSARSLVAPLSLENRGDVLEFCLDSGGYATNLLREVFKEYTPLLFSPDLNLGSCYH